jgi:hypothetical protein
LAASAPHIDVGEVWVKENACGQWAGVQFSCFNKLSF